MDRLVRVMYSLTQSNKVHVTVKAPDTKAPAENSWIPWLAVLSCLPRGTCTFSAMTKIFSGIPYQLFKSWARNKIIQIELFCIASVDLKGGTSSTNKSVLDQTNYTTWKISLKHCGQPKITLAQWHASVVYICSQNISISGPRTKSDTQQNYCKLPDKL